MPNPACLPCPTSCAPIASKARHRRDPTFLNILLYVGFLHTHWKQVALSPAHRALSGPPGLRLGAQHCSTCCRWVMKQQDDQGLHLAGGYAQHGPCVKSGGIGEPISTSPHLQREWREWSRRACSLKFQAARIAQKCPAMLSHCPTQSNLDMFSICLDKCYDPNRVVASSFFQVWQGPQAP